MVEAGSSRSRADRVAERRAAGLAKRCDVRHAGAREMAAQALELRALPGALDALEDDQPPARRNAHPSVMMGLAAPFRMPSRIHWFTCTITLSKFSFVTITRW